MNSRDQFDADHGIRTDGQIHLGPVNIGDMSPEDMLAAELHPALHTEVRYYAGLQRQAYTHRIGGNVHTAQKLEAILERIYENIPEVCRW